MSNAPLTLDDLGHDVLLLVLSHLDDPQEVAHYAKSSRNSREVAQLSELPRTVRYLNAQRTNRFRGFRRDGHHDAADFVHNDARPAMVIGYGPNGQTNLLMRLPVATARSLCTLAAAFGELKLLKRLRGRGIQWGDTLRAAAGAGHLETLQWAASQGCLWTCYSLIPQGPSPRARNVYRLVAGVEDSIRDTSPDNILAHAAAGGHLPVLKWARGQGARWPANATGDKFRESVSRYACIRRDFEMMQWLADVEQNCPWSSDTWELAIRTHDLQVMKWLRHKVIWRCLILQWDSFVFAGFDYVWIAAFETTLDAACDSSKDKEVVFVEILQWLWDTGLATVKGENMGIDIGNQNAFQKAAAHGLLLVHKWGENHHYVKSNRHSS